MRAPRRFQVRRPIGAGAADTMRVDSVRYSSLAA
jgi:hypothetical protein